MKFYLLLLTFSFSIISSNAAAANYVYANCSWEVTSTLPKPGYSNPTTYACYSGTTLYATAIHANVSYAGEICQISPMEGYATFPYDPINKDCTKNSIYKIVPDCPVATNGCSTDRDLGKLNIDATWVFPELSYFNGVFNNACNTHDTCYGTIGMSKSTCDLNFRNDMKRQCDRKYDYKWYDPRYGSGQILTAHCKNVADVYYTFVASEEIAGQSYIDAQNATKKCQGL